jgi:replicative DNA helicase
MTTREATSGRQDIDSEPSDQPPQDIDSECACLGAFLQDRRAAEFGLEALREEMFYLDRHRHIFRAIRTVMGRGERADLVTVATALQARGVLYEVGGSTYLAALVDAYCPVPSNYAAYVRAIKEAALRRRLIEANTRALAALYDPAASVPESVAHHLEQIEATLGAEGPDGKTLVPVTLAEALTAWRQENADGRQPARIKTPIPKLNACLGGGLSPGELVYLGARPGVGKTALATEIARAAAEAGTGVCVVSREMVVDSLTRRILSQHSRIPASTIKEGTFEAAQYTVLTHSCAHLSALPLWLIDQVLTLSDITHLVEHWAFEPPLGLLIVDYLQLVRAKAESRRLEVEMVSQGLKTLAVKCKLPILCLSSLSRPEKGADRKPIMADLRESGELEHDADVILLLHRGFQEAEATLIVAKNRDGRVGETSLRFLAECVAFNRGEDAA